jgi:hypothetical protein
MLSDICQVSDGMRVVGKCLRNILIPCFGSGCVWEWRKMPPNRAHFFVRKNYTTFSTEQLFITHYYNLCNVKIIYHVTFQCVSRAFCSFQIRPGFGTRALYPLSLR